MQQQDTQFSALSSKQSKKGNFLSWPGIESILFKKYLPRLMATAKGHLGQERKNLQSTKLQIELDDIDSDNFPKNDTLNKKNSSSCVTFIPIQFD